MTVKDLRAAYSEACRKPQDLDTFVMQFMPKAFALLEYIEDAYENHTSTNNVGTLMNECLSISIEKKTPKPERYTGGR